MSTSSGRLFRRLRQFWLCNLIFCEIYCFHIAFLACNWPSLPGSKPSLDTDLHVGFIADPQLTDSLSYDYPASIMTLAEYYCDLYMRKNFVLLEWYFKQDLLVMLGDLFDNGREHEDEVWDREFARFEHVFRSSQSYPVITMAGNHDLGLGANNYGSAKSEKFVKHFGSLNQFHEIKGVKIAYVNTLAFTGNPAPFGSGTEVYESFKKGIQSQLPVDILLTHIPLHRPDDEPCGPYRTGRPLNQGRGFQYQNLLNPMATNQLLQELDPSIVFSGDDHDHCTYVHQKAKGQPAKEFTVGTFSWLQGNLRPSFALLSARKNVDGTFDYGYSICKLPNQLFLLGWYGVCFVGTILLLVSKGWNRTTTPFPMSSGPPSLAILIDPDYSAKAHTPSRFPGSLLFREFCVLAAQMLSVYILLVLWYYWS